MLTSGLCYQTMTMNIYLYRAVATTLVPESVVIHNAELDGPIVCHQYKTGSYVTIWLNARHEDLKTVTIYVQPMATFCDKICSSHESYNNFSYRSCVGSYQRFTIYYSQPDPPES